MPASPTLQTFSHRPLPAGYAPPEHDLPYYESLCFPYAPGSAARTRGDLQMRLSPIPHAPGVASPRHSSYDSATNSMRAAASVASHHSSGMARVCHRGNNMLTRQQAVVFAALITLLPLAATGRNAPLYQDPSAPLEQRVDDLLARMTLEEKSPRSPLSGFASRKSSPPASSSIRRRPISCSLPVSDTWRDRAICAPRQSVRATVSRCPADCRTGQRDSALLNERDAPGHPRAVPRRRVARLSGARCHQLSPGNCTCELLGS